MKKNDTFEKNYFEQSYHDYQRQNPSYKLKTYLNLVKKYVPQSKDHKVLDAGCAFGSWLKMANRDYSTFGADISRYAIAMAKKESPKTKFQAKGVEEMNFKEKMDAIVSFDCLEHIISLPKAFSQIKKQAKKETYFFFVMPVYDGFFGKVVSLLDRDPTHVNKKSRQWWLKKLKEEFEIVEWYGIFRYLLFNKYYLHFLNKFTKGFSPAILIVAKSKNK